MTYDRAGEKCLAVQARRPLLWTGSIRRCSSGGWVVIGFGLNQIMEMLLVYSWLMAPLASVDSHVRRPKLRPDGPDVFL